MITFDQFQAGYQKNPVTPFVNGHIMPGTLLAVTGANGSGKSTLLKTLAGLIPPVSGHYIRAVTRGKTGLLPQQSDIDKQFPINVFDLVAMGCWQRTGWFGAINRQLRQEIMTQLDRVRMADFACAYPSTLSGGQLQRVLFARLLMQQATLLLLDEPFTGIDQQTTQLLMALLIEQQQQGKTVVVVLHDSALVERYFPHQLHLTRKQAVWSCCLSSHRLTYGHGGTL